MIYSRTHAHRQGTFFSAQGRLSGRLAASLRLITAQFPLTDRSVSRRPVSTRPITFLHAGSRSAYLRSHVRLWSCMVEPHHRYDRNLSSRIVLRHDQTRPTSKRLSLLEKFRGRAGQDPWSGGIFGHQRESSSLGSSERHLSQNRFVV